MEKVVKIDERAVKELKKFDLVVQKDFLGLITKLEKKGRLEIPEAKKITRNIFELRIQTGGAFRGFYAYIKNDYIMILHFFRKKSQKTPTKNLKLAERRLKAYEI